MLRLLSLFITSPLHSLRLYPLVQTLFSNQYNNYSVSSEWPRFRSRGTLYVMRILLRISCECTLLIVVPPSFSDATCSHHRPSVCTFSSSETMKVGYPPTESIFHEKYMEWIYSTLLLSFSWPWTNDTFNLPENLVRLIFYVNLQDEHSLVSSQPLIHSFIELKLFLYLNLWLSEKEQIVVFQGLRGSVPDENGFLNSTEFGIPILWTIPLL